MNSMLQELADPIRQSGRRRFANWNDASFQGWLAGPGERLSLALACEAADQQRQTIRDFLRLLQEGIGQGYIGDFTGRPQGLLDAVLREQVPDWLAATPPHHRTELLAEIWNVSEGLAREAEWMEQYALARHHQLDDPAQFTRQLAAVLDPVLSATTTPDWSRPLRVLQVDTRAIQDDFLPGAMQLIAPIVLRVFDRRRESNFGLLLQRNGRCESVGALTESATYEGAPPPDLVWEDGTVRVGDNRVELPFFHEPLHVAVSPAGFLVVSTANSQRLWIIETTE